MQKLDISRTENINSSVKDRTQELARWQAYFKQNAGRERNINWDLPCTLEADAQKQLIYLLDQFGHAEEFEEYSGQQMIAAHHALLEEAEAKAVYAECLEYYRAEEQRHAQEFFKLVKKAGGQPTPPKPPDLLTRLVLKIFNVGTPLDNLAALHVTELISCEFYARLQKKLGDPLSQSVLSAIIKDERAHLAFHADYLKWASQKLNRRQKRVMWFKNSLSYWLMAGPVYFFLRKGYYPLVGEGWRQWRQMCRTARQQAYPGNLSYLQKWQA